MLDCICKERRLHMQSIIRSTKTIHDNRPCKMSNSRSSNMNIVLLLWLYKLLQPRMKTIAVIKFAFAYLITQAAWQILVKCPSLRFLLYTTISGRSYYFFSQIFYLLCYDINSATQMSEFMSESLSLSLSRACVCACVHVCASVCVRSCMHYLCAFMRACSVRVRPREWTELI